MNVLAKFTDQAGITHEGLFTWSEYNSLTWNPECKIDFEIPLVLRGYGYKKKKETARNIAIAIQNAYGDVDFYNSLSAADIWYVSDFLETAGGNFGLLREFRENGVI